MVTIPEERYILPFVSRLLCLAFLNLCTFAKVIIEVMVQHHEDGHNGPSNTIDLNRPTHTHGRVQLQDRDTGAILLVPQPSSDPNDPLNW